MISAPDPADIQAIVDRGFGSLDAARYLLIRIDDPAKIRAWLRSLPVTTLAQAKNEKLDRVCQVAFTAAGLVALGLDPAGQSGFAPEFVDGMAGDPSRSRRLGDVGLNAPANWRWGTGALEPHLLVILLAREGDMPAFESEICSGLSGGAGTVLADGESGAPVGREPFGFLDGVSQPRPDWENKLTVGGAKDRLYRDNIAIGEFLLGHGNEYGFVTDYPRDREIGFNGSYLVYRQLVQDVTTFWSWLAGIAGEEGAVALAEHMVGRDMDGRPLAGATSTGPGALNDFTFADDPDGAACPIGAHIRRANPRSGDDPNGRRGFLRDVISSLGLKGTAMHDAVASARFHRILRRGRSYGPTVTPSDAMRGVQPAGETGLHFICLNANFARQFEFVQGAWLATPYFGGLSGEQDPMVGNRCPVNGGGASDAFSYVDDMGEPRLVTGMPQVVKVVGGAYFFLPSIRSLGLILKN